MKERSTGTGIQIAAITKIDHRPLGTGHRGPIVSALRKIYFDVVRGKAVELEAAKGYTPRGVVHRPRAPERTVILMIETAAIVPTGD